LLVLVARLVSQSLLVMPSQLRRPDFRNGS
jgi:hypothetical protein